MSENNTSLKPFPKSTRVYINGSREDIRVPMREIVWRDRTFE